MKKISFFIVSLLLLNAAAAMGQKFSINNSTHLNIVVTVNAHDGSHPCGSLVNSFVYPGTISGTTLEYLSTTAVNDGSCPGGTGPGWSGGACATSSGAGWDGVSVLVGCSGGGTTTCNHSICGAGSHTNGSCSGTAITLTWNDDGFGNIEVDIF